MRRLHIIRNHAHGLLATALCTAALSAAAAQNTVASAAAVPVAPAAAGAAAEGGFGNGTTEIGDGLHLVVGRSIFINTSSRLRRIYVSNPDVLESFTASPHQIVVTARSAGMSGLILWDEGGESKAYEVSSDVDVSELRRSLKDALPSENIHVEARGDEVALSGTVSNSESAAAALKLAGLFSKNVADSILVAAQHTPQVRLKVRFVEIDRSRAEQLGFNFFTTGKNTVTAGTGEYPAITVAPQQVTTTSGTTSSNGSAAVSSLLGLSSLLNMFYYNSSLGLGAAIQALESKQILQILAEPTITALSGEKASFLSGGEFPFPVVQGGTGGFTSVTIQFRPYGVTLNFTPTVLPDGTIDLKVAPEVSSLDYSNEVTISGYTIPALSTRKAETRVQLRSGQSFAISGLLDNQTTDQLEKVPGIGDIPILGKLFQTKNLNHSVEELAVIVTPTLVDPLSEAGTSPKEPQMAIPFISDPRFDRSIAPRNPPQEAQPVWQSTPPQPQALPQ